MKYGVKNFIYIAKENVDPDLTTFDGIQRFLITWFCDKYNTTRNDPRLLDMTLEELLVLYQEYRIKDDPNYFRDQTDPTVTSYEDWLKKEMGEDYLSEEASVEASEEYDREYTKKIREKFPDKVTTDFSQFKKE